MTEPSPAPGTPPADGPPGPTPLPAPWRGRLVRGRRGLVAAGLISVLTLLLGFAFAVQVRSADTAAALAGQREEDLVRILDDLTSREQRLRQQLEDQRTAQEQLGSADSASAAALAEARERSRTLGLLNGTLAAQGPGLEISIADAGDRIGPADLINLVHELRAAGAETMQIDGVRIGADSEVTGTAGDLSVDGTPVEEPYTVLVIGPPQSMETALKIPNGSVDRLTRRLGTVAIRQSDLVVVDALRPVRTPQYAEPSDSD
ncbi:DUF881 domain-containing protein [Modestobacter roseus]|uniref:Uncharacterized protein YlxW (UPF0749 family) n=1 Tax=Modestobacter roseus TaxID=1181884 RepID=A0A562IPQ3_9ACTN|nr:DUF881 domain-containing protein [Modestobacter roseus]MQA35381.1 DUF881 domain-containing protein [Modestobacter roseus]TWH72776.1 uncharacterized protein YlxW (UPF0749 family) [Modestobacter roseus]